MKRLIFILCIAFSIASCGNKGDEPAPTPPATAERTLLVYMVANNDLGQRGYDDADITEMRAAARSGGLGKGRLLLMHQSSKGRSVLKEINAKGNIDTLLIYDDAEPAVSIARMTRVFDDMKRLAPAKTYGLVLWSHGSGWLEDGWADPDAGKKRAFGLDGTKSMNITSLAQALQGRGFDYVYFDCCHMASVEVAYELRNTTDYIVGSVTELPNYGMPYDANIPLLLKREPDLKGAAANTFNLYDEKTGSGRTCTISVISTGALDDLAAATRLVYTTATPLNSGATPQAFERGTTCRFFDMEDYMERIATDRQALDKWREALRRSVLYSAATPEIFNRLDIKRHCGLSTFTPRSAADMNLYGYNSLQWATDVAGTLPWTK